MFLVHLFMQYKAPLALSLMEALLKAYINPFKLDYKGRVFNSIYY